MSLTFFGVGQSCTALSLMGSMHSLPLEIINPKYSTDVWLKEHLAGRRYRSNLSKSWKTLCVQ